MDRNKFADRFDVGVPLDASNVDNDKVMILYNDKMALPDNKALVDKLVGNGEMPVMDIEEATKNCDVLDLVLVQSKTKKQCRSRINLASMTGTVISSNQILPSQVLH